MNSKAKWKSNLVKNSEMKLTRLFSRLMYIIQQTFKTKQKSRTLCLGNNQGNTYWIRLSRLLECLLSQKREGKEVGEWKERGKGILKDGVMECNCCSCLIKQSTDSSKEWKYSCHVLQPFHFWPHSQIKCNMAYVYFRIHCYIIQKTNSISMTKKLTIYGFYSVIRGNPYNPIMWMNTDCHHEIARHNKTDAA